MNTTTTTRFAMLSNNNHNTTKNNYGYHHNHTESRRRQTKLECKNCGIPGHLLNQCKFPITSVGIIALRNIPNTNQYQILMIRRKDTMSYVDFLRGKYPLHDHEYLLNMLHQMTMDEKQRLLTQPFHDLWNQLWNITPPQETPILIPDQSWMTTTNNNNNKYKLEEMTASEKMKHLLQTNTLQTLIDQSNNHADMPVFYEPEWGWPKGKREYGESDFQCANREFSEESGYLQENLLFIHNVIPLEEYFTSSNYKSYKHRYFLVFMDYENTLNMDNYQKTEVGKMEWKTITECLSCVRYYNVERIKILRQIQSILS
jgi:8-oxo-dGTP pyrophosphatase MutT (NUDIX family)